MQWCRIALTRLSCETTHRLGQLTVHWALCCEVIRHSPPEKKLLGLVSPVGQNAGGGGGPTRVPRAV